MERFNYRFTALGAGAFCLLAYPGIFSRLSNDGKQSPASFNIFEWLYFGAISFNAGSPIRQPLNNLKMSAR